MHTVFVLNQISKLEASYKIWKNSLFYIIFGIDAADYKMVSATGKCTVCIQYAYSVSSVSL